MFTSADLTSLRQRRRDLAGLGANIKLLRSQWAAKSGFDPNQPRVPAGHPDGGQWTDRGGSVIHLAQNVPRRPGLALWPNATLQQQAELLAARIGAATAIARVRQNDRNWAPRQSVYPPTIQGEISARRAERAEADARHMEHLNFGVGPGPYASGSIRAREGNNFTAAERLELNRIGSETGCHTCGARNPGPGRRNFFFDHQPANSWRRPGEIQFLYPHCATCSYRQGGYLRWHRPSPP